MPAPVTCPSCPCGQDVTKMSVSVPKTLPDNFRMLYTVCEVSSVVPVSLGTEFAGSWPEETQAPAARSKQPPGPLTADSGSFPVSESPIPTLPRKYTPQHFPLGAKSVHNYPRISTIKQIRLNTCRLLYPSVLSVL